MSSTTKANNRMSMSAISIKERMAYWKARETAAIDAAKSGTVKAISTAPVTTKRATSAPSVTRSAIQSTKVATLQKIKEEEELSVDELMKALQQQGIDTHQNGFYLVRTPSLNKGQSFSLEERQEYGIRGLFPAGDPISLDLKVKIAMEQLRSKTSPLEKYIYLHTIQDSDETLFYAILTHHTTETMPLVYTPTVGEACIQWSRIFRHTPRGLYLSIKDKGSIRSILDNSPMRDVKVIVVTDGERTLGLGDLGVNGMGIPIGKLALYTACAGIDPAFCLPVHIDVGTETESIRNDPTYMGLRQPRVRGQEYEELIQEFFDACQDAYGRNVLIQFEDFGNTNAFSLLTKHRTTATTFNDDIQGTASVVLAGVIASLPLAGKTKVSDHTYLFYGAGEAGMGIADLISTSIKREKGCSIEEARRSIWLYDSKGIIHSARTDSLTSHKKLYAHTLPSGPETAKGLISTVTLLRPTVLVGASAQSGAFSEGVCKELLSISSSPLILALSNPTSKAECTAAQAYEWTNGRCIFFSGCPFDPVTLPDGRVLVPSQVNDAYIFPGVGLGVIASGALTITDDDFAIAASTLAAQVSEEQLAQGCAYPSLSSMRALSLEIAIAIATNVIQSGRASPEVAAELSTYAAIKEQVQWMVYEPTYEY